MLDSLSKDEIFFVSYDDIIKAPAIPVLKLLILKYSEYYKEFIDFEKLNSLDTIDKFYSFFLIRKHKNVLEELAIKKFDYVKAYNDLYNKKPDILDESRELFFSLSLQMLILQKFTKSIYIWTEQYDERVRLDLIKLFGKNEKINYIIGDIKEAVNKVPQVSCFVLNDITLVDNIIHTCNVEGALILVANYMYNYKDDENKTRLKIDNIDNLSKEYKFKLLLFNPMKK